jgi:hypothetical protein
MKKAVLFLTFVVSIQSINAHITSHEHAHESFIHEWAWLLIPAIAALGLIWKYRRKSFSLKK